MKRPQGVLGLTQIMAGDRKETRLRQVCELELVRQLDDLSLQCLLPQRCNVARSRSAQLREMRKIRVTQHQADVRVADDLGTALCVHDYEPANVRLWDRPEIVKRIDAAFPELASEHHEAIS